MTIDDIYFYWDAAFGPEVLSPGAGDAQFSRTSPAWREDRRRAWRPVKTGVPRVRWIPPAPRSSPRVALVVEPGKDLYPRRNVNGALGWTNAATVTDQAAIITSGLGSMVPGGQAARIDNSSGGSPLVALAINDPPPAGPSYTATVYRRRHDERFYRRIEVGVSSGRRVEITVPPGEEWFCVLPQIEAGAPTTPWPMPATNSPRTRGGESIEWVTYLPSGTDFYLHHEFEWADGVYSLGTYFGPAGFCTVLRLPDGTVTEEPVAGLPPLTIVQEAGWFIRMTTNTAGGPYRPLSIKLLNPRGFSQDYSTLEGFLREAERLQVGPGGLLITDE